MTTFASNTLALGPDAISADSLAKAGLVVVLLIVFAESGLLFGFFLPGDSLLFTMGLFIARDEVSTPLPVAAFLIGLAAVAGDQVGYMFGRKVGPSLFRRSDSRFFKQEYVEQAHEFFEKHGSRSIVLARFVPIVRTFTPVIAGVSRMNYRVFVTYNVIGGLLWGCGVTVLGFYLGKIDFVHDNVEAILILIVLISVLPIAIEYLRARRKKRNGNPPGVAPGGPAASVEVDDFAALDDPARAGTMGAPGRSGGPGGGPAEMSGPPGWSDAHHDGRWEARRDDAPGRLAPNDASVAPRSRRGGGGRHSAGNQRQGVRRD